MIRQLHMLLLQGVRGNDQTHLQGCLDHKVGNKARLALIVDQLFIRTIVQISTLTSLLKVSYPTANKDVERLEALGLISPVPDFYPKTYYAKEIYNIAFHEPESGIPSMDK